jgi:transcriptional regulator with XRE-family HTH domain
MGRGVGLRPKRLAAKLRQIRRALALSQNGMVQRMGLQDQILREEISDFERGKRQPPLLVLLEYARAANVHVDDLIDDKVKLPAQLPAPSAQSESSQH